MGFTMGLNLLLLMAMVATNILSLYHLSTSIQSPKQLNNNNNPSSVVPDHLLHQLQTIRATINHLTRHRPPPPPSATTTTTTNPPSDLLIYSRLNPIASSCHDHPDLLNRYMNYTPFSLCPSDSAAAAAAEALILRGCHPLPRRRCFARTPPKPTSSLPHTAFPPSLPDQNIMWDNYNCKSFSCLNRHNPNSGFDMAHESLNFITYKSELDLPVPQLFQIAKAAGAVLRLGLDVGGGTGTFAARMKPYNVTILTTTMNFGAPNNEAAALRGLVPLHVPLQQRFPVFDGVLDLVRCGHAVNRWIPLTALEFLLFDVDRVLRGGGYLWLDHFFGKAVDVEKVFGPLIGRLGYKRVKWATASKSEKNGEVYLTALLQKPVSR